MSTTSPATTGTSPLQSTPGRTVIADGGVATIAGPAAREVDAAHGSGTSAARVYGDDTASTSVPTRIR